MRSVGIRQLRNKLSEYLKLAESGETILVTDHNRVVAELSPPSAGHSSELASERWSDLVRRGIITPARVRSKEPPRSHPIATFEEVMRWLDESRGDH